MVCKYYLQLAKLPLTAAVLVTTAAGYVLASAGTIDWQGLTLTVVGTGLAAIGAGTFNQLLEVDCDAKMQRTCGRPLPTGTISRGHAFLFATCTSATGLGILNELVNPLTALLGLVNMVVYTLIYTPLKQKTSFSTLIGAICGSLPPVIGWTAAANQLAPRALLLAAILFVWQIPHFLSFVWLHREDYLRAGYRILPVIDSTGRVTALMIVLYSLALMPLGLAVTFCGLAGYLFGAVSLLLGLGLFLLALRLYVLKTRDSARQLFLASIVYLPLVFGFLMADSPSRAGVAVLQAASAAPTSSTLP